MAGFSDLKFYYSTNVLGGPITGDDIESATPNNVFVNFERHQLVSGSTKYKCIYLKNESAELMDNFKVWISSGTPLPNTNIAMGFDTLANVYDGAVGFNGTDDYINCGNHADLWSKPLTKFAFSIDIYPTAAGDGNDRYVVSHGGANNDGFRLIIDQTDNDTATFRFTDNSVVHECWCGLNLNQWNQIVCSYDGVDITTNNMKTFNNGVLQDQETIDNASLNISADLTIADDTNDFKGYVRDFKFWDHDSITADEAEELFETGEIEGQPESYHLNFSERTGSTTLDLVSRVKTASFQNGTFWKLNAQSIPDTFTEPHVASLVWYGADEKPGAFSIKPGLYVPIWFRLVADPDPTAEPFLDDNAVISLSFDIVSTGTGTGGTPGTGGGTGGNPGGSGTINYKIAVAGDWGNTGTTNDVLDLIKDQDYDLVLGVGDNAYDDSSASSWCNKFKFLQNKMESAWGNHEYEEDGGLSPYKNFFGYGSQSYHHHRFQNCLILILDSNDDKSGVNLDTQRTWAKGILEQFKNDTNVVWRIAVMHHPWFGDGGKHEENEFDQVQKFHKLFTDYDVNFVYTGHNHNWQRTHQVGYNSGDPQSPNTVDSSSPYSRSGAGLIYIVSGTGGHDSSGDLYSLPDDESFFAYRNKSQNGVHELVASNNGNTLTGKFRNVSGNTSDTFVINA